MKELGGVKEIYAAISHSHRLNMPINKKRTGRQHISDCRYKIGAI
jgi:hypothetical protein